MGMLDKIALYNQMMEDKKEKEKEEAKKRLKRDEEGKPIIKLIALEDTVVNTPTQEDYDILLQVYECGGWKWGGGDLPTSRNYWNENKKEMCVDAGIDSCIESRSFGYCSTNGPYIKNYKLKVLSTQEFYKKQNITKEQIKEIKDYFENEK